MFVFPILDSLLGFSSFLEEIKSYVFIIAMITYLLSYYEIYILRNQRFTEVSSLERKENMQSRTKFWIKFVKSFSFCFLMIFFILNTCFLFFSGNLILQQYLESYYLNPIFITIIVLIIVKNMISAFIRRSRGSMVREILVQTSYTRGQKLITSIKVFWIISFLISTSIFILLNFIVFPLLETVQNISFLVFIGFVGGHISVYTIIKIVDLNYKRYHPLRKYPYFEEGYYALSNLLPYPRYQKGFAILKLTGIKKDQSIIPNFRVLRFLKELVLEVQFSNDGCEIYVWLFYDGFDENKIFTNLQAMAQEFSTLFPSASTRLLSDEEAEKLIDLRGNYLLRKTKKNIGIDFLNPELNSNKLDELMRSLTTFSSEEKFPVEGSVVFNFKITELPELVLRRKRYPPYHSFFGRIDDDSMQHDPYQGKLKTPGQLEGRGHYIERETVDIGLDKRKRFEREDLDRAFFSGFFQFDMYVRLKSHHLLERNYYQDTILKKIDQFIYNIYNIELEELSFFQNLFLNHERIKFRQRIDTKVFRISGFLLKHLLTFPSTGTLDIEVIDNYHWEFPVIDQTSTDKMLILGQLIQYKDTRNYLFPFLESNKSVLILGNPGAGKTTLILSFISQIKKFQCPFIVFDLKYDYLPIIDQETLLLQPGHNFFLNLFDCSHNDSTIHANFLTELVRGQFTAEDFSPAMEDLLYQAFLLACQDPDRRNLDGFWECVEIVSQTLPKRNRADIVGALRTRVGKFFRGALGQVLKETTIDIYHLFEKKVIIDLKFFQREMRASFNQLNFLVRLILQYLYYHILERSPTIEQAVKHLIILDDTSAYLKPAQADQTDILQVLIQLCRSQHEGLIVANQGTTGLKDEVIEYPNTLITFITPDSKGLVRNKLGLPESHTYPSQLAKYTALVKYGEFPRPFPIRTIPFDFEKTPHLEQIAENTDRLLHSIFPDWNSKLISEKNSMEEENNKQGERMNSLKPENTELIQTEFTKTPQENLLNEESPAEINHRDIFKEIALNEELKQMLRLNLEQSGFLTVEQIQRLLIYSTNPNLRVLASKDNIRHFLKILVIHDQSFAKKSIKIEGLIYKILILQKYASIFDKTKSLFIEFDDLSAPKKDLILCNRQIFLNEIENSRIIEIY